MSIALNGFKVLQRLGESPDAFTAIRLDVDKAARTLVVKSLKAKSTGLEAVRGIHTAIHDKQFGLIVEGLKDAEVKSLLTKLDKHHPNLKTMSSQDRRQRLLALTSRTAEPSSPAAKVVKAKKKADPKTDAPQRLQSDVMDLFRARGREVKDD